MGAVPGCCKQYVIASSTNAAAAAATKPRRTPRSPSASRRQAATALPSDAPQSAYTPIIDEMETKGATFGRSDLPFSSTINMRAEAASQNFTGVKAWFCLAQCYSPTFISQGGANAENQYVQITNNPFEDAASIPAMKKYLANGGPQSQVGLESYVGRPALPKRGPAGARRRRQERPHARRAARGGGRNRRLQRRRDHGHHQRRRLARRTAAS